ncbi:sperm-associated antigen 5 [Cyprinodon tularosa]|uniref:sperm-associated antigen 5 n=1 Tax=Cyprinodon tularosa TaxID=77115 RepID=UPI0018E1F02A|nr:sperm-associated antigen 5 [Cyprinodon tularosa]
MSHSSITDWSSSRSGERTPLRSRENELLHLSSPSSRLSSKPQLCGDAVKTSMANLRLCDTQTQLASSPLVKGTPVVPDPAETTWAVCGLGDVTFKSLNCSGEEVEVPGWLDCEGNSLILPEVGTVAVEMEDTVGSPSRMEQSCSEHVEHPYSNQPDSPSGSHGDSTFHVCETDEKDLTWKPSACDGGEVEVFDSSGFQEETVPLPHNDLRDSSQDDGPNSAEGTRPSPEKHVDHLSCIGETSPSFTPLGAGNPTDGLADLTLKLLNCSGGEVEISEDADPAGDTIPLSHTSSGFSSYICGMDPSTLGEEDGLESFEQHLDHPYYDPKYSSPGFDDLKAFQDLSPCGAEERKIVDCVEPKGQDEGSGLSSDRVTVDDAGKSDDSQAPETVSHPQQDRYNPDSVVDSSENRSDQAEMMAGEETVSPINASLTNQSLEAVEAHSESADRPEGSPLSSVVPRTMHPASAQTPFHEGVQQHLDSVPSSTSKPPEAGELKDVAPASLGPTPCSPAEKHASPNVLKMLSECPSVASALQLFSPIVKRTPQSFRKLPSDSKFLSEDLAIEDEKGMAAPVNVDLAGLLAEHLESPMPRPLLNSTELDVQPQPGSAAGPEDSRKKPPTEAAPPESEGQFQQQLRQMAELLYEVCGKMGSAPPPAAFMPPPAKAAPAESHSIAVGTSPVKTMDHSLNTSGIFVRRREFSVADSSTMTDTSMWNFSLPPGGLQSLPREELEQRLMSSMIMVEVLIQQIAAAKAHGPSSGPPPSDLREKLVQTDHTELSQTTMHRELYLEALSRIDELELDVASLQNLIQAIQHMRTTMSSLKSDTDAALSSLHEMGETVREDHRSIASHYEHIKSLMGKMKESQARMLEKVKEAVQQRNDMRTLMEEAATAKEAAFCVMDQLRMHCASEISALEKCVGSQQELLAALNQVYPKQVALKEACNEALNSASNLLSETTEEHSSLMNELCTVRSLLKKTSPILVLLKDKAAAALRERDQHCSAREQAIEEREQMEEELNETHLKLQTATQQNSDSKLQITILTSEMGVLRQKLMDKDEETGQLERKVTELSATTSSTLASYTFLEQALAAETTKLQQSWQDLHQANERESQLKASLEDSEQRVSELSRALAENEDLLAELQNLSQSQSAQIQQLQDVCTQLGGVRDMNEFLQNENEFAREQVVESEKMLRNTLQGLRERNIECEDLKAEVSKLRVENKSLCEELEIARSAARAACMELKEKMGQAVTEVVVLHHTLREVTKELQASLGNQTENQHKHEESTAFPYAERRHPSCSLVDSVMVALTGEKEEDVRTDSPSDTPEPQSEVFCSETSAFTRIGTPKKNSDAVQDEEEEEEEVESSVAELLSGLSGAVTELISTLKLVQQRRDEKLQELNNTICGLQVEQQTLTSRHQAEVLELKQELQHLSSLAERGKQALEQKAQDEKTLTKLMADVQEAQDILSKHKSDNNDLRKDVTELRRALKESRVESQVLWEELGKAGVASAHPVNHMEEKIELLKKVERLKASLQEAEQAKVKILERAKRHQIIHLTNQQKMDDELQMLNSMLNKVRETLLSLPEVVKHCEHLQQLVEYIG